MMALTTIGNPRPSFGLIVHHTDAEREYAYDKNPTSSGKLTTALEEAPQHGWTVVDVKKDRKKIWQDKTKDSSMVAPIDLLGKWLAEDIDGKGVLDRAQSTLEIDAEGSTGGDSPVNRYQTQASIEGDRITFGPLVMTRRAEPAALMDQESKFISALQRVTGFRVEETGLLYLTDAHAKNILRFSKGPCYFRIELNTMIVKHITSFLVAATVLISSSGIAQDDKLPLLLKRSPAKANAIGYVNIDSLNKLMSDAGFAQQVSDNVNEYWFLADLDLMKMQPRWEAGYATMENSIVASELAERVGGYVDKIDGEEVVWSPQQAYLYPGKDNRLGVLRPANRSLLSGWLTPSITVNYSSYLDAKAKQPESFLSMMLAIELKNVFSPVPLAKRLEGFTSMKANTPESVAQILASASGLSIIIGRRSLNECILTITCTNSPAGLKNIAPAFLSEMLERSGMSAPEVLTWTSKVEGNELSLQGPITESTLSGLLSIFSLQNQATKSPGDSQDSAKQNRTQQEQIGYRSKYYFDEVTAIVEQTRKHKSTSTGALAIWNDKRARQIDELGTLNVDPGMIQYGSDVAETLRGNALNITQGNIEAGKTKVSQGLSRTYSAGGYYGDGGYYDPNSSVDYQAATSAYARGNAYANFKDALNQIDQITAEVRRSMTDKYKMQF